MLWTDLRTGKDDDGQDVQMEEHKETTELNGRVNEVQSIEPVPINQPDIDIVSQDPAGIRIGVLPLV